jgi:predicted HTH transcriptional regulator
LDYRGLTQPWGGAANLERAGVEIEAPIEPTAAIEALIASGEGPAVEFKSKIPETALERRRTFKTVAAFANGDGGTIIVGVDDDDLTIVGCEGDDPAKLRDTLGQMVRARVVPTPPFSVTAHTLDGKVVLVLRVEPGASPPYGITVDKDSQEKPEFYVRRGASIFHVQPSDLREVVLARQPAQGVPDPPFLSRA